MQKLLAIESAPVIDKVINDVVNRLRRDPLAGGRQPETPQTIGIGYTLIISRPT